MSAVTLDSNLWAAGSRWDYRLTPSGSGTRVEVTLVRQGKGVKGKLIGALIPLLGRRMITASLSQALRADPDALSGEPPAGPVCDPMQTRTVGTTMPILEISLAGGETLIAEGDNVSWYTPGMDLETSTRFGSGGKGGFMSGLKRALGGGALFLTEYTAPANGGFVAFATRMPGVIRELAIDPNDHFMVQSGQLSGQHRRRRGLGRVCSRSSAPASSVAPE